jgi:hypothetical protein
MDKQTEITQAAATAEKKDEAFKHYLMDYAGFVTPQHGLWNGDDRMLARLSHLSIIQQQRIMRARAARRRHEEAKTKTNTPAPVFSRADWYAKVQLARQARALHLLRAFMKGQPYKQIEKNIRDTTMQPGRLLWSYLPCIPRFSKDPAFIDMLLAWLKEAPEEKAAVQDSGWVDVGELPPAPETNPDTGLACC